MVTVACPRAVVGREDHDGIFRQAMIGEGLHDLAPGPVQFQNHIAVETCARLADELIAAEQRHVRHGVREVDEKRLVVMAGNEINRVF